MASFEELDYAETPLGELILRRRRPVSMPGRWVYEVKLGGRFLMSSLVHDSEEALADLALAQLSGGPWRVLVGGLGLGHTAAAVLRHDHVAELVVVELLPEVVAWHEKGIVPFGQLLCSDPRCRLVVGDCFDQLRQPAIAPYDAVLIDIDDAPQSLLHERHGGFYTVDGLGRARRHLLPGGVLALWTSVPSDATFLARLRDAFGNGRAEEVAFDHPLLGSSEANAIYFARA